MSKIKIAIFFLSLLLIGCAASKQGNAPLSAKLKFLQNNFKYDAANKNHFLTQQLLDSVLLNDKAAFSSLVGVDTAQVKKTLGSPDYRESGIQFGYRLGKCPKQINCEEMFLSVTFSDKGICLSTSFERSLKPEISPNKGIKKN